MAPLRTMLREAAPHAMEWVAEAIGTFLMVEVGLHAILLDFGRASPMLTLIPPAPGRLLVTGLIFPITGSLFALSPLGRRSGAHLNPAVTFAFWLTGHVRPIDLAGYVVAQAAGASVAALGFAAAWGGEAASISYGQTLVRPGLGTGAAVAIEALMTAVLVGVIFGFTSRPASARWTPLAVYATVATLVFLGAPYTGTSLNPARSFGPDLAAGSFADLGVDLAGPLLGAAVAAIGVRAVPRLWPLTAKLFHDARYLSVFRTPAAARAGGPIGGARRG